MAKDIPLFDSGQSDIDVVRKELKELDDRAAAILAMTLLELRIKQMVEFLFVQTGKPAQEILGTEETSGELSFSYQCRLAYCLGAYGRTTLSDLTIIARVRNKFAHSRDLLRFSTDKIADRCRTLKLPSWYATENNKAETKNPRERYMESVTVIFFYLFAGAKEDGTFSRFLP